MLTYSLDVIRDANFLSPPPDGASISFNIAKLSISATSHVTPIANPSDLPKSLDLLPADTIRRHKV